MCNAESLIPGGEEEVSYNLGSSAKQREMSSDIWYSYVAYYWKCFIHNSWIPPTSSYTNKIGQFLDESIAVTLFLPPPT